MLLSGTLCVCKCTCSLNVCYTVGEDATEAFTHNRAKWLPLSSLWLPHKCECLLRLWAPSAKQSSLCRSCGQPPQGPVTVSVDTQDSCSHLSELQIIKRAIFLYWAHFLWFYTYEAIYEQNNKKSLCWAARRILTLPLCLPLILELSFIAVNGANNDVREKHKTCNKLDSWHQSSLQCSFWDWKGNDSPCQEKDITAGPPKSIELW